MKAHCRSSLSHSGTVGDGMSTTPYVPDVGKQKMLVEKQKKRKIDSRPQSEDTSDWSWHSHNQISLLLKLLSGCSGLHAGGGGGGGLSRCLLIVPADCAPLDADGAVSSTMALRWLNLQPVKLLLITYILLDGPRGARLNAPGLWRPSRRQRFTVGGRGWFCIAPTLKRADQRLQRTERISRSVEQSKRMQNVC